MIPQSTNARNADRRWWKAKGIIAFCHADIMTAARQVTQPEASKRHVSIAGKTTGRYSKSALGFVQNLAE